LFANLGIFVYVWFRFTPQFASGAILALIHDVIISLGVFALTGHDFELPTVAALLTIVGYSINDTIVIFDHIRDNLKTTRMSVNQTLSRTILTSLTTLFTVLALYLFTEGEIKDFAFVILVGIISGTYSTLFVAMPLFVWLKINK
jgi:preprotein translocase subunit SecF